MKKERQTLQEFPSTFIVYRLQNIIKSIVIFAALFCFFSSSNDPLVKDCIKSYTDDWSIVNRK